MSALLGLNEAERLIANHLGDTPRARHSQFVAAVMAALATSTGAEEALWRAVGLLHDIDYPLTAATPEDHGLLAAEWLAGRLPEDALLAIAAHDHRSGVISETPIARGLKLADALAVLDERAGRQPLLQALGENEAALRLLTYERPWLAEMVLRYSNQLHLTREALSTLLQVLPPQSQLGAMTS